MQARDYKQNDFALLESINSFNSWPSQICNK